MYMLMLGEYLVLGGVAGGVNHWEGISASNLARGDTLVSM